MAQPARPAKVVEPATNDEGKWYKGLEKVQSYFVQPHRDRWNNKIEYILSCVGYCIGFGNIWRYPYVVYENGGSAFIFPYICVVLVMSIPLFYMETILGQFSGCNPVSAFNFAPICKGIGIGMIFVNFYVVLYYIIYMAYATRYLFASFSFELPWMRCSELWGADQKCFHPTESGRNLTDLPRCEAISDELKKNYTIGVDCFDWEWPAQQYWHKVVLKDAGGTIDNIGEVHWDLLLLLLLSWVMQYLHLIRGIKTSGKLVYFTATFPFLVLLIMLVYTLTLDGSVVGLEYLFKVSDWTKLFQPSVWRAAITQAFFSTGIGFGCLILYSSYNDFNFGLQRITVLIIVLDLIASILSAMTVFSVLGYLAKSVDRDVSEVVTQGPALIFITMPQAIAGMPVSHLWSVLYFLMLYTVGIDSLVVMVDTVITTIYEEIPTLLKHQGKVRIICILLFFLLSIPDATRGGFHVVNFLEVFSSEVTLIFFALCEVIALMFIHGIRNFDRDISFMTGKKINIYWKFCWVAVLPFMLIILLFLALTYTTACDKLSIGFCAFGWIIVATCVLPVPIVAIVMIILYKRRTGSWESALKPSPNWGPREPLNKIGYVDYQLKKADEEKKVGPQTQSALKELEREISTETPDVQAVATKRVRDNRMSVFHRFSDIFHPGEIEHLESSAAPHPPPPPPSPPPKPAPPAKLTLRPPPPKAH